MSSAKKGQMVKFCRIFQWLEAQDPALAAAVRDLCLERALTPGGRAAGVTFLYPKEKAYREEIINKTYSSEADEADKIVRSLIIPDALTSGASFQQRGAGSLLGVKYSVESADDKKVKLADGVELAPAEDFDVRAFREGSLAVWVVTKGRLPLTGEPYKAPAAPRRGKTGGSAAPAGGVMDRCLLARAVEAEFKRCQALDRCRSHDPYLAKVVSLLNFLRARRPEILESVLPLIDYDPAVTFYLLLEPYKMTGAYLVDSAALFGPGAWNGVDAFSDAVSEYKSLFAAAPAPVDRAKLAAQVDVIRLQITNNPAVREIPQAVHTAYVALVSQNSVAGLSPVLPDSTRALLTPAKKLWQDEFRFIFHEAFQSMRAAVAFTPDLFDGIVADICTTWPGNDYASETILTNITSLRQSVSPRDSLMMLRRFILSTDFLYTSVAPDLVGEAWGSATDVNDQRVYNRNAAAMANLNRVQGMVRPAGISESSLRELEIYAATHAGALPPGVAALAAGK